MYIGNIICQYFHIFLNYKSLLLISNAARFPYIKHHDVDGGNIGVVEHHGVGPLHSLDEEPVGHDGSGEAVCHRVLVGVGITSDRGLVVP